MSEEEELERRLDHMFGSARPRPGFEDQLWERLERSRPWYRRLGRLLKPAAVLAPALAVVLVGGGFVVFLAGHRGAPSPSSAGTATQQSVPFNPAAGPTFGKLPPPAPVSSAAGGRPTDQADKAGPTPAALPASAPVYRFDVPASGIDFALDLAVPESFTGDPAPAVQAFLARHGLLPTYPYKVVVEAAGVRLVRQFPTEATPARLVSVDGRSYGVLVFIDTSTIKGARGPADVPTQTATYPLRRPPSGATRSELVYVIVLAGDHGFFEPALLTVGPDGTTSVLSAIDPAWLLP